MKKLTIVLIFLLVFLGIVIIIFFGGLYLLFNTDKVTRDLTYPEEVTNSNFQSYLENQDIVKSMPESGKVVINFNEINGSKNSYIIEGKGVRKIESYDINLVDAEVNIPARYMEDLDEGLCSTIIEAKENGELLIVTKLSNTDFALKYFKLLKYKDCMGA